MIALTERKNPSFRARKFRSTRGLSVSSPLLLLCVAAALTGCATPAGPVGAANNGDQNRVVAGGGSAASGVDQNGAPGANKNANGAAAPADDKAQRQKVIDRYLAGVAKVSDASEYKEARRTADGDLDGDGDADTVVQFTLEGFGGGNNYGFYLAVFRNDGGKLTAVTDDAVGGKLNRDVTLQRIEGGRILLDTKEYDDDDGACCPSVEKKTTYVLAGGKLVEKGPAQRPAKK